MSATGSPPDGKTSVPLVSFEEPGFDRPRRSTPLAGPAERAVVIDNGSYQCRVGWAGEAAPRLAFRNQVIRPRSRTNNELVTVVGEWGSGVKGYDFGRASARNAFDGNVVVNYEVQEMILDYAFDRLALTGGRVDHPVLITEGYLNPSYSRAQMAELLFEAYGIPTIQFAVDSACAYVYSRKLSLCGPNALLLASGHSATHAVPFVDGEPYYAGCYRTRVSGAIATDHLHRLLCLRYPQHSNILTLNNCQQIKEKHSFCSSNYLKDLDMAQKGRDDAGGLALRIQLPWKPVKLPTKAELEEEAAQKAARAAEQRQRLKDMVDARKAKNMRDKEIHIKLLKDAAAQVECAESSAAADDILKRIDMEDYEELKKRIDEAEATLQRLKGLEPAEQIGPDGKQGAKLDLLDVTDSELTPEQLAEKRRQRLAKHAADARAKLKAKKEQERLEQEQLLRQEDEALRSDPERYLEALKQRHRTAAQRVENRKRRRLGAATAGASDEPTAAGCRRVSSEQRHRMRLLARAAAEGKRLPEEDTFGENDRDWDVYKEMDRNYSDSEVEREDDTEYNWTAARLQGLGQASCIVDISGDRPEEAQPQVAEDYQLCLGVERIRVPELLFQPSMCGIDQAGAGEVLAIMLREMPAELAERCASGGLLITGGNSAYPGLDVRLESELRSSRPEGRPIRVVRSPDAMLDAWRGAALMATVPGMFEGAYTKAEYEERGPQGLRRRCHASYSLPFRQQGP